MQKIVGRTSIFQRWKLCLNLMLVVSVVFIKNSLHRHWETTSSQRTVLGLCLLKRAVKMKNVSVEVISRFTLLKQFKSILNQRGTFDCVLKVTMVDFLSFNISKSGL